MPANYTARGTAATVLTTELNSLAGSAVSALSAAQDNDTAGTRDLYAQAEIYIAAQASNRAAGAYVALYLVPELDGTNYGATTDECLDNYFVGSASLDDGAGRPLPHYRPHSPAGRRFQGCAQERHRTDTGGIRNTVKLRSYTVEDAT